MTGEIYKLENMLALQQDLQLKMPPHRDPTKITDPEEIIGFIKDMKLALEAELQEALDEVGWKPWANKRYINTDAFKSELVDMWHFFMNLMLVIGMDADELFDRYVEKRQKNIDRQEAQGGYDGVSTKCPQCRRALDDTYVMCDPTRGFCEMATGIGTTHDSQRFGPNTHPTIYGRGA